MLATELTDQRLDLRDGLVGAGPGSMGTIGERGETAGLVASDPAVDALARDAQSVSHLGDLPAVLHDREHGLIALLHDA